MFLGVTQPCNYAYALGRGVLRATMRVLGRKPVKRPVNCHCHALRQTGSSYGAHSWCVTCRLSGGEGTHSS